MAIDDIFTHFPRIETDRLILRQIQASDAQALFAFYSDEEVIACPPPKKRRCRKV